LNIFKNLVKLRKEPSFQWGEFDYCLVNEQIFSFVRSALGFPMFIVVMNMSNKNATNFNLQSNSVIIPNIVVVKYFIPDYQGLNNEKTDLKYQLESFVRTCELSLDAHSCLILSSEN
jgi:hypothetical protein